MSVDGRVSAGGEVLVPITVHSGNETAREIEALVDTGFNGGLALPARHIEELKLSLVGRERMLLASGDLHFARTYRASVELKGKRASVRVVETGEPLVGMALLWGYDLRIECVENGRVVLNKRLGHE
jgi:clan AA aspartic protease